MKAARSTKNDQNLTASLFYRLLADTHRINSSVLASRKGLLDLARGDTDVAVLHGWRREMAGAELLAICAGQRLVSVDHGKVVVSEKPGA